MCMIRPICPECKQRPRAIAYHKYDRIYYRGRCTRCLAKSKNSKSPKPRWQLDGYKKKPTCDRCGFRSKFSAQLLVYHVDGNLNNSTVRNLKSICQNCVVEIKKSDLPWRPGELEPDF
jgi:hypothetical protein